MSEEFIWAQKYRPNTIKDCIVPEHIKDELNKYIEKKDIPHFLLCSESPGTGKTTVAKAICEELGADYLFINASMERSIGNLRTTVTEFVSSMSLQGGLKVVILDEADNLTKDAQKSLRGLMEQFSSNARFILTCNNKRDIYQPIASRCNVIEFAFSKEDLKACARAFMARVINILEVENIEYDRTAVAEVIRKFIPDNRSILNKLQSYANKYGAINSQVMGELEQADITHLLELLRGKKFIGFRDWVFKNGSTLSADFYSKFYRSCVGKVPAQSEPAIINLAAQYQFQHNFAADAPLNILSFLTDLSASVDLG